jgi:pimeloyl-ACP methyl ester carboxylesterase
MEPGPAAMADVTLPAEPCGLVVFAHGSGSSRHSVRNRQVAAALVDAGLGTVLLDLLTADEERAERQGARLRFDIDALATRLGQALDWAGRQSSTAHLPIGLFGASTGAAAALLTAAHRPADVAAVVSRGGRPDLAGGDLVRVTAPTLLVVGGLDTTVLALNRRAAALLGGKVGLEVVDGATHLFEQPGALQQVAELAAGWFLRHLVTEPWAS